MFFMCVGKKIHHAGQIQNHIIFCIVHVRTFLFIPRICVCDTHAQTQCIINRMKLFFPLRDSDRNDDDGLTALQNVRVSFFQPCPLYLTANGVCGKRSQTLYVQLLLLILKVYTLVITNVNKLHTHVIDVDSAEAQKTLLK